MVNTDSANASARKKQNDTTVVSLFENIVYFCIFCKLACDLYKLEKTFTLNVAVWCNVEGNNYKKTKIVCIE